jgi:adenylate cyclase
MFVPISFILRIIILYAFITFILIIGAAVRSWRQGYQPATYYLISWGGIFVGGFLYGMKSIGVLPNIFITSYGLQIGAAMEVILLSVALAARINSMKKEKEEAQKYAIEMQTLLANSYARFVPKEFLVSIGKSSILDVRLGDQVAKEMTVMFSDIRSFTELSEKMTPEQNFNFINSYLSRMNPIIQNNGGYIDKYLGDGIMALFDGHPDDAVKAAIQMQKHIVVYNLHRYSQGYDPIQIGIGMHTGKLMMGTIGGEDRMEGTVISDSVNLSSRIEGITKIYGVKIAISEKTFSGLNSPMNFHFRFLDRVQVKGKSKPTLVYEIYDGDNEASFEKKYKTTELFETGINLYYNKKFKEAKECFSEIASIFPEDKVTAIYIQRSDYFMNNPIESTSWEGVSVLTEK